MSEERAPIGSISWLDLTVPDADGVRDFYAAVVGWTVEPLDMGEYSDYVMASGESGAPVAGVCHARGVNAALPAQWLVYITVDDLARSMERCVELGGRVVAGPSGDEHSGTYCVIQDPAGAVMALFQHA